MNSNGTESKISSKWVVQKGLVHLCYFLFLFSSNYMRIKDINNSTYNNNNNDKNDDGDDDNDNNDKDCEQSLVFLCKVSYCTRNLSTPAAKPRTARNEGVSPRRKNKRLLTLLFCLVTTKLST